MEDLMTHERLASLGLPVSYVMLVGGTEANTFTFPLHNFEGSSLSGLTERMPADSLRPDQRAELLSVFEDAYSKSKLQAEERFNKVKKAFKDAEEALARATREFEQHVQPPTLLGAGGAGPQHGKIGLGESPSALVDDVPSTFGGGASRLGLAGTGKEAPSGSGGGPEARAGGEGSSGATFKRPREGDESGGAEKVRGAQERSPSAVGLTAPQARMLGTLSLQEVAIVRAVEDRMVENPGGPMLVDWFEVFSQLVGEQECGMPPEVAVQWVRKFYEDITKKTAPKHLISA
jgi:hypothetical protein